MTRQPVRLGKHGGKYIFDAARGLHESVMGLAVLGTGPDPEIMFEEHGTGTICQYIEAHDDAELNPALGPKCVLSPQRRNELAEHVNSEDPRIQFMAIASAFGLEDAEIVNEMLSALRRSVQPEGGAVWIIQATRRHQRRRAMLRIQHAAQAQPLRALSDLVGEPQPLEEHAAGSDSFVQHYFEPLVLLASPYIMGVVASRAVPDASEAYTLIVWLGQRRGVLLVAEDEIRWSHTFGSSSMYRDVKCVDANWLRDLNVDAGSIPIGTLVTWWTDRLNALLTEATDLGRYRRDDGILDGRRAYRESRTLDRLFIDATRVQLHPHDHLDRVSVAFEIFDLLPGLIDSPVGARDVWANLLDPARASKLFEDAFADAPDPIRDFFVGKARSVLTHIEDEIVATVAPGRVEDAGILVGDDEPVLMPIGEYLGRLFQALRDTHHGYELSARWKREILDTHTGHIPYGFPELALLYVFALVSQPQAALGGEWFST